MTDGQRNNYTCFAWAGGTFFPVVLLCQILVLAGNRQSICCGGKVLLRPEKKVPVVCLEGCAVVSVFGSSNYDRKKKVLVLCLAGCAVVSVFGSGNYDRRKKKF